MGTYRNRVGECCRLRKLVSISAFESKAHGRTIFRCPLRPCHHIEPPLSWTGFTESVPSSFRYSEVAAMRSI
ncbi:hypothetical protein CDL15_Pgr001704 [Punica granatum]|uniref:Zinc finger GRF-type domain-containing protein n=1 Tax=Punica granatum TaxID=22663 RepID=A0A218XBP3_PUNGR|nr:hypothetical protein CDL15_Pgr001704 [Punica granatum]